MDCIYVKRTQKDYTMYFKLQVVREVEDGIFTISQAQRNYGIQCRGTVVKWLDKYGNFDPSYKVKKIIMKTAEQRLFKLSDIFINYRYHYFSFFIDITVFAMCFYTN